MDNQPPESFPTSDAEPAQPLEIARSRVRIQVNLAPGTRLNIHVQSSAADGTPLEEQELVFTGPPETQRTAKRSGFALKRWLQGLCQALRRLWKADAARWEVALLALAAVVYLLTRWIGLERYPIFFFTDEAVQTVLAQDFIRDGLRGYDQAVLPTFFLNMFQYNLGASVYLQVLPYLLLGKSILVTRGVSALVTLLAALCCGLLLRQVFHKRYAWSAALLLSITPAWFLHSRTAFETSLATAFYAGFLYFYLRYRSGAPRALYWSVAMAALAFYSYSPARMVVGLTAVLLFLSDLRYHLAQRGAVMRAAGLALLLGLPYLRFIFQHPAANQEHLIQLNSYWIQNLPWTTKLGRYFSEYLRGLNPLYWYLPNGADLARHKMDEFGHVLRITFPLLLGGLGIALRKIRQPAHRALIIALLAAPSGAALVALGITRALLMVVPLALLSGLGLCALLEWLERRFRLPYLLLVGAVFLLLAGGSFSLLRSALVDGPYWHSDYGLGGMQWGARQVYGEIRAYLRQSPDTRIILSPSWANGADIVARFFFADPLPFELGSIEGYMNQRLALDDDTLFIMIPQEFIAIQASPKFKDIRIEKVINYPNGEPGFFFVRLRYVDDIDQMLEAERQARKTLLEADLTVMGQPARVRYSHLDMGSVEMFFDGDVHTLARTLEANPLVLEIEFQQAVTLDRAQLQIGGPLTEVSLTAWPASGTPPLTFRQTAAEAPNPRPLVMLLNAPLQTRRIRLEVRSVNDVEPAHVHLWEVDLH